MIGGVLRHANELTFELIEVLDNEPRCLRIFPFKRYVQFLAYTLDNNLLRRKPMLAGGKNVIPPLDCLNSNRLIGRL
ncbi:hypothetical protein D3C85_1596480 [compost metagenome]